MEQASSGRKGDASKILSLPQISLPSIQFCILLQFSTSSKSKYVQSTPLRFSLYFAIIQNQSLNLKVISASFCSIPQQGLQFCSHEFKAALSPSWPLLPHFRSATITSPVGSYCGLVKFPRQSPRPLSFPLYDPPHKKQGCVAWARARSKAQDSDSGLRRFRRTAWPLFYWPTFDLTLSPENGHFVTE